MNPETHRGEDLLHKEEVETSTSHDLESEAYLEANAEDTTNNLEAKVKELEEQANKNYDLYVRTYAEMENLKKRFQKEKETYLKFGSEGLLRSLLVVLDNLEAAMEHLRKGSDLKSVEEGLMLTLKSFYETLEKAGVTRIDAKGKPFDPNLHEALMEKEHDGNSQLVLEELQKGYMLYDRLLRPSKVVISKSTEKKD